MMGSGAASPKVIEGLPDFSGQKVLINSENVGTVQSLRCFLVQDRPAAVYSISAYCAAVTLYSCDTVSGGDERLCCAT